ncbi:plasmodesmata-located protein 2-like isoform X2 [Andrographis paniculata]|uniref:plasmodesmata-located protein 2-like isoform X2 n=1 Tax=Andrographis paniculata TaxID=175694 RepID=UPI0021E96A76|nr:plasmodesmata-located protein 2-like isoform X2 [Andrographis paniculata]
MFMPRNPFWFIPLFLAIAPILGAIPASKSAQDLTTIVYKGCAKQDLSDPTGVYSQALSTLFGTLISQSSKAKFSKTSSGSGQSTVTGLFQCRGDLSNVDCYNCVSKLPILIDRLCGKPIAARIQLFGCYMLYEVAGFAQISGMEMLYKSCSGTNVGGAGFEERRDTALSSLENGMMSSNANGGGFYTASYQSVYALGQCEGDVGASDCVECVKSAAQRAQVECGSSIAAQIYLHKCFISYTYYPNGVPKRSSSSPPSSFSSPSSPGSGPNSNSNTNTGKTVAIILGGAAGVGFLVICMLFARGLVKKKDSKY